MDGQVALACVVAALAAAVVVLAVLAVRQATANTTRMADSLVTLATRRVYYVIEKDERGVRQVLKLTPTDAEADPDGAPRPRSLVDGSALGVPEDEPDDEAVMLGERIGG